jgi:hypothetical protein
VIGAIVEFPCSLRMPIFLSCGTEPYGEFGDLADYYASLFVRERICSVNQIAQRSRQLLTLGLELLERGRSGIGGYRSLKIDSRGFAKGTQVGRGTIKGVDHRMGKVMPSFALMVAQEAYEGIVSQRILVTFVPFATYSA